MTHHLLILTSHAEQYADLINQAGLPDLQIYTAANAQEARPYLDRCTLILGSPNQISDVINEASQVAWVQSTWAGVEPLVADGPNRRNYRLTRAGGVFGPQMSEYVFGHLILQVRQDWVRYSQQQKQRWHDDFPATLHGRTIGLLGVGSIGAHLAQTAKHFGMTVWGYTHRSEDCNAVDRYFHEEGLLDFVAGVDCLVNSLPHTATSTHIINQTVLDVVKPSLIFINVGRGSAVDERALAKALHDKKIAGAVLDVFEQEPLPAEHPLWQTPNTIITSHTAAVSYPHDIARLFIENYRHFISNRPLTHLVDFARGY